MNKNKGFIGIGLIIAIVLGIVVVGGGAYYLGVKKNTKAIESPSVTNKLEENNSHEVPTGPYGDETNYVAPKPVVNNPTTPQVVTGCDSNSKPSIKVLSPNGGEVFKSGDKVTVKWSSCNVAASTLLGITLSESVSSGAHTTSLPVVQNTPNDGSETFVLSNTIVDYFAGPDGYPFKMDVSAYGPGSPHDWSDNSFTINSVYHAMGAKEPIKWETYSDNNFGFSFSYPLSYKISTDNTGKVSLIDSTSTSNTITILKSTGSADDSNGKFGKHIVSYNNGWIVQKQNEQDGSLYSGPINPMGYTYSGLPIFNGGTATHGWGSYGYIVALSHTKFLIIEGPDNLGNGSYNEISDPTLVIVKLITAI